MPYNTEAQGSLGLTREEQKILIQLLQHPKIKDLAKEIEDSKKNNE